MRPTTRQPTTSLARCHNSKLTDSQLAALANRSSNAQPPTTDTQLTRHVDARRTRRIAEKNSKDAATARSDVRATRMRYHRTWRAREGAK